MRFNGTVCSLSNSLCIAEFQRGPNAGPGIAAWAQRFEPTLALPLTLPLASLRPGAGDIAPPLAPPFTPPLASLRPEFRTPATCGKDAGAYVGSAMQAMRGHAAHGKRLWAHLARNRRTSAANRGTGRVWSEPSAIATARRRWYISLMEVDRSCAVAPPLASPVVGAPAICKGASASAASRSAGRVSSEPSAIASARRRWYMSLMLPGAHREASDFSQKDPAFDFLDHSSFGSGPCGPIIRMWTTMDNIQK